MGANYGRSQQYKYAARAAESEGRAIKTSAYRQANNLETEAKTDSVMDAENMSRMATNKNSAKASIRTNKGASGFTSEGSNTQSEIVVADIFDQAISDMSLSNAISDQNKRYAAEMTRYQGDLGMQSATAKASQYRLLGKNALQSAISDALATATGAIIGSRGMINSNEKDEKGDYIPYRGWKGAAAIGSRAYLLSGDLNSTVPGSANRNSGYLASYLASLT